MPEPLVSLCLPTLNARAFLEERLETLRAQTLQDWELIACDSGSEDGTWETLRRYENDPRLRLFQVPRAGVYAGWNECLRRARGRYVHIATADDTCRPDFLEKLVTALERHPDADLAVCQFDFIDAAGRVLSPPRRRLDAFYGAWLERPHRRPRETEILLHLFVGIPWTTAGALVFRAALLSRAGWFEPAAGADADRYWSLRASFHSDTLSLPERLATWRQRPDQVSRRWEQGWPARNWRRLAAAVDECRACVPAAWQRDAAWREKLLAGARAAYRRGFCLDRGWLRRRPLEFAAGLARAAAREPAYAWRRLATGLTWQAPEYLDGEEQVRRLIDEWHIAWEPRPLEP